MTHVPALYDALTGLPNRQLFEDRLVHALQRYHRDANRRFAVLSLDLNRFRSVNEDFGYSGGDALLIAVGQRLRESLRVADTIARLGADEFTVLLEHCDATSTDEILRRVADVFLLPFQIGGREVSVTASVSATFPNVGHTTLEEVLHDADPAVGHVKACSTNHVLGNYLGVSRRAQPPAFEADLRLALERQTLDLYFQPIVDVDHRKLKGFEVLVRWQHPEHGLLPPKAFVPLAEETGLIIELDRYVLNRACDQLAQWQTDLPSHAKLSLNVNLSSRQFARPELVPEVQETLLRYGLNPQSLNLEITENLSAPLGEVVGTVVHQLMALGIGLYIDDFGTGFASLDYLRRFPATVLKIERSFLTDMLHNDTNLTLVKAIVQLAHTLGMKVVAEGVETPEQLARLQTLRCEFAQGYLFAKPLNKDQATAFITAARRKNGAW